MKSEPQPTPQPTPQPEPVRPLELLRMAARTARQEPARVFVPAVVVFALDAFSTTTFTELTADHHGLAEVGGFVVFMFSTLGLTFYSGLLERLVGAVERDLPAPPVRQVLRQLPYGRLLVADLILLVLDAAASAAFVVPGIIATTLFALVGPVISTRGTTVWAAFRQSVRLVAPQFLLVLAMITLPLAVENEVVTAVAVLVPHENLALVFLSHAALGLVFGLALGLVEVSLAERLLNGAHGPGAARDQRVTEPGAASAPPLRSTAVGTDEGGHHGRDDSRHGDAGTGALPPAG